MTDANHIAHDKPKRRQRSPHGPGLFVTDVELAEIMGLPVKEARMKFLALDQNPASGFPKKDRFWGDRRYLPAVEEWLKATSGRKIDTPPRRSS